MLHIINITNVVCYILTSYRFGVWAPSGWYARAETCRRVKDSTDVFVICTFFGFIHEYFKQNARKK